jgi:hypothetical protein
MAKLTLQDAIWLGVNIGQIKAATQERITYKDMLGWLNAVAAGVKKLRFKASQLQCDAMLLGKVVYEVEDPSESVDPAHLEGIRRDLFPFELALLNEAEEIKLLGLTQPVASARLQSLKGAMYDDQLAGLYHDTLRCLQSGAYRAAIVMGWNLTYDFVRRWVFRDEHRRGMFNSVLVTKQKSKAACYAPITTFDAYFELSERNVIDWMYEAKLLSKEKHQVLVNALTDRNHFAHPSSRKATATSAAGYIENLVVNILTDAHFA